MNSSTNRIRLDLSLGVLVAGLLCVSPRLVSAGDDPMLAARLEGLIGKSGAEVAVAFRTLDGRDELFMRADEPFHAASTMKVPVMIELFRQAEAGRLRLDDAVPVTNRFSSIVDGSPYELSAADDSDPEPYKAIGGSLTYRQLCEAMITVSSNLATNILIERLGVEAIRETVAGLRAEGMNVRRGVEDGKAFRAGLNNTTTARALLVLLEAIGRGSAVSAAASRDMIDILKRQRFNDAIPAGVPPGTTVAHKTGSITRIHHDAALVLGSRPYVLVILVRGLDDEQASAALIADLTRLVHASTTGGGAGSPRP